MQHIVITGGCGFIGVNLIRFLMKIDESVCIRVVDNLSVGQLEVLNKICTFQMIKAEELTSWDNGVALIVGDILDAISPYGASKLCGEAYCSAYFGSFGLETVALRFGNVYGPYSTHKGSVVAKFIKHIMAGEQLPVYGDGNQTRDFIYVDDLVNAILLAMEKPDIGGEVFQIATHKEHTVAEVAESLNMLAEKYLGRKSEIVYERERKGEVRRNYSDISKARRLLGFEPKWELERGLEETFLWFLKKG